MVGEIFTIQDLVRSISIHITTDDKFKRFQRMYSKDRIAFVYDIMPELARTIAPYQVEILSYFDDGWTRVGVRSPHGSGKTTLAAVLTHHSVLTAEEDCKVPTTASAWRQLEKYLWPEIRKTEKMIDWLKVGREPYDRRIEFMQLSIRLKSGLVEAFALSSDDHQTIEGAHGTRLVYIFDEAKAIPRDTWNAAEGAFANANIVINPDIDNAILNIDEYVGDNQVQGLLQAKIDSDRIIVPGNIAATGMDVRDVVHGSVSKQSSKHGIHSVDAENVMLQSQRHSSGGDRGIHHSSLSHSNILSPSSGMPAILSAPSIAHNRLSSANSSASVRLAHNRLPLQDTSDPHSTDLQAGKTMLNWHSHRVHHADVVRANIAFMQQTTTYEALALAISTPGIPSGQFYDIMSRKPGYEHWKTRHITLDDAIHAGRISASWAAQMKVQWGEYSSQYQNRVLGNFAEESEETIIPLSWIEAAVDRWSVWDKMGRREIPGQRSLGVDVARLGTDKTVIADRHASVVQNIHSFSKLRTTETSGRVKALASNKKINIEMDGGLGASVYDMLRENDDLRSSLVPITVSARTGWRDKSGKLGMFNVRTAMWWNMRQLLDPEDGSEICLPDIDELIGDLSAPKWEMMKDAVVKMESKKEIIARLGRSTDYGDAVCLAFWGASSGGGVVF